MIPVAPLDQVARNAIRKTWGGEKTVLGKRVSHFFLLGQAKDQGKALQDQLLRESQEHRDLLQGNFLDSYRNLTIKTILMLEWLASRCPNASYGIKTDSDVLLNVHSLIEGVIPSTPTHLYMTGNVLRQAPVHRDPNSKWFTPKEVFAESQYPPYVLGLSYVFSMDLPSKLIEASRHESEVVLVPWCNMKLMEHTLHITRDGYLPLTETTQDPYEGIGKVWPSE
ncbi:Beta-1,3-galactosyltransferase 1 [Merluccius polli]|uniref:Hexosyltransferase n=1 Tax=Merluccius polli TaxID=89951 RepID=A0AA47M3Z1_MERPO|nr:Beta-1,3-galactosyltransferase 1 [Merluccius polli]